MSTVSQGDHFSRKNVSLQNVRYINVKAPIWRLSRMFLYFGGKTKLARFFHIELQ